MFPQIFGKYVLEREIAAGGMAKVFLGTLRGAVGFEKRLVVKQIRPELASDDAFVRRFVEEAKTAVELSHPNIVPVYELGVEQGIYYIAMELCEGVTLAEILRESGTLSPEEGAYVGIEICRALDYAHRRAGIVHGDVTPRNVLIDEEGAVRVIDFGIAAPADLPNQAGQDELFGSPGHMPPEQLAGRALTAASDVFAVGTVLMEAWTGKPPFRRKNVAESLEALKQTPPRLDAADSELAGIANLIASTLALEIDQRPQTAERLSRPLREFTKSADLGDVARRLGARVRNTRARLSGSTVNAAPAATGAIETRPVRASVGDTQTFAVRNDLAEWSRKLSDVPAPPPETVVEPVPASEVEATRRLPETANPERGKKSSAKVRATAAAALAGVGLLAIAGLVAVRPGVRAVSSAAAVSSQIAPIVAHSSSATPEPPASVDPAPPATESAQHPVKTVSAASDKSLVDPAGKATLSLTADPNSQVTVGSRTYTTPALGIALPAGSYSVTFTNTALNDRATASVKLEPGQKLTVHADFRGDRPNVFVH